MYFLRGFWQQAVGNKLSKDNLKDYMYLSVATLARVFLNCCCVILTCVCLTFSVFCKQLSLEKNTS